MKRTNDFQTIRSERGLRTIRSVFSSERKEI